MAYHRDLAHVHDAGFTGFARDAGEGILEILSRQGIRQGLVVDLGCGSGVWARRLADAGYGVLGIDISADMIEIARVRVPEAELVAASYLEVELPSCVAVTSLGECFNYLFDEAAGHGELRRLFRRIHDALEPGGVLLFDMAEPGRGKGPAVRHREGPDWEVVVHVEEDAERQRLTRRITTFRQVGELYRRHHEVHELRLYRRSVVLAGLRGAGFRARTLSRYGRWEFPAGWVAFEARKV